MKTIHKIFQCLGVMFFVGFLFQKSAAQCNCTPTGAFPATVNGINISVSNTGDVTNYGANYTSCGITAGPMYVGQNSSFSQTFTFSSPVNNISYVITASSASGANSPCGGEDFTFSVNAGAITTSQCAGTCPFTQTGNTFCSTGNDDGTIVIVSSTSNFTSLTVSGSGGSNGSLAGLCIQSFTSCVAPTLSITPTSNICSGSSQTLTVSGASSYTWNTNASLSTTTGSVVIATPANTTTYSVVGTSSAGCTNTISTIVNVTPASSPTLVATANFSICSGQTASLSVTGASTYTWFPSINLSSATGSFVTTTANSSQTFTVIGSQVACGNSYTASTQINMTTVITPTITISATSTLICSQAASTLTANGAGNYLWLPTTTIGTALVVNPASNTTYTVFGATSTCTNSAQIAIVIASNPTISVISPTICSGTSANLVASGGISYTWSPSNFLNTSTGASVTATPPASTTYSIVGESLLGCKTQTVVNVTVVPTPTLNIQSNPPVICTGSTSAITVNGASSYTWFPSTTLNNLSLPNVIANPISTTIYTVIGGNNTLSVFCLSSATIQIKVKPKIIPLTNPNTTICLGQTEMLYSMGGNEYHWLPINNISNPNDSVTTATPTISTIYTVSVSQNGMCTETATVSVFVNPLPILNAGNDTTINMDESYVLHGIGNVPIGFLSSDKTPLICNWCSVVEVYPKETTCYTLEGFTNEGCRAIDEVCIKVTKDWDIFIPNAFTPNGDETNAYFLPTGFGYSEINLTIYDRWGNKIFDETNTKLGWDGSYKGIVCQQGVYIYKVEIKTMNSKSASRTGHVTLLGKIK